MALERYLSVSLFLGLEACAGNLEQEKQIEFNRDATMDVLDKNYQATRFAREGGSEERIDTIENGFLELEILAEQIFEKVETINSWSNLPEAIIESDELLSLIGDLLMRSKDLKFNPHLRYISNGSTKLEAYIEFAETNKAAIEDTVASMYEASRIASMEQE